MGLFVLEYFPSGAANADQFLIRGFPLNNQVTTMGLSQGVHDKKEADYGS